MAKKQTRAPKRRKQNLTPMQRAILTGGPLPDQIDKFYVRNLENPDAPGLLAVGPSVAPFADVWKEFHGRDMTDQDRKYLADRVAEIRARQSMAELQQRAEEKTPEASNWPEDQTDGFQSIAKTEIIEDDR